MPIALLMQSTPLDWKGLGAILGVILAALAIVRVFGSPIAEKGILWVLRAQVKRWDTAVVLADDRYQDRARGWDTATVLAEANRDKLAFVQAALEAQGREMNGLERTLSRCEANAETLQEIKRDVAEIGKNVSRNTEAIATLRGFLSGERRTGPPTRRDEEVGDG